MSGTAAPPASGLRAWAAGLPAPVRAVARTVRDFVARVLVEPVREGRLRSADWPPGLRPIVVIAVVGEVTGLLLVLLAGPLRSLLELSVPQGGADALVFPRELLPLFLALAVTSLALAQAGALHAPAWARWTITSIIALVLVLASTSELPREDGSRPVLWTMLAAAAGLVLLVVLRGGRRRRFAWWEFLVVLVLIGGGFIVCFGVLSVMRHSFGIDGGALQFAFLLTIVGQLAMPAAIAAGSAVAELAVSTAAWSVTAVRDNLGAVAVIVVLAAVAVWRLVDLGLLLQDSAAEPLPLAGGAVAGALILAAVAGMWLLLARIRGHDRLPAPSELLDRMGGVTMPVAIGLTLSAVPAMVLGALMLILVSLQLPPEAVAWVGAPTQLLSSYAAIGLLRILVGAACIAAAMVAVRRGVRALPELLAAIGVALIAVGATGFLPDSVSVTDGLALVGGAAALLLLVVLLLRRRLTPRRRAALAIALLASALFAHRDFIADPFAALLGFATLAVVLLGLLWNRLTGFGAANGDSAAYPRPARVMLALGNSLFAVTVLAFVALARNPAAGTDLGAFAVIGQLGFGNALIAGTMILALYAALRDREAERQQA